MKICKDCKIEKPLNDFYKNGKWYVGRCKKCYILKFKPATGKLNLGKFKKGRKNPEGFNKGRIPWNKGKKADPAAIRKMIITKRQRGKCINSWNHKQWKKAVFERDNHECKKCYTKEHLCAHHIKPWKECPEMRFEIDNGLSLCNSCHAKVHGKEMCNILNDGTSWNKGVACSEKIRKSISEANKGKHKKNSTCFINGHIPWNKGLKLKEADGNKK